MLSIILKRVQNARNYLSNERLCTKFGRFFAEILISEYQEISRSGPYSKLKTERGFHREVQNVTGPESQASLTRGTDAQWLYPTNLDANLSTLRWLSTILGAVSGNSRDGACFKLDKQTWRRKEQWYTHHDFSKSTL